MTTLLIVLMTVLNVISCGLEAVLRHQNKRLERLHAEYRAQLEGKR